MTMKGKKNTPTVELKEQFSSLKGALPKAWKEKYISLYHSQDRGLKAVRAFVRLGNIQRGNAAPTPTELQRFRSLS